MTGTPTGNFHTYLLFSEKNPRQKSWLRYSKPSCWSNNTQEILLEGLSTWIKEVTQELDFPEWIQETSYLLVAAVSFTEWMWNTIKGLQIWALSNGEWASLEEA